jgi:hypothetical protein
LIIYSWKKFFALDIPFLKILKHSSIVTLVGVIIITLGLVEKEVRITINNTYVTAKDYKMHDFYLYYANNKVRHLQGTKVPEEWENVNVGDPVAFKTVHIHSMPLIPLDKIFDLNQFELNTKIQGKVPAYPDELYYGSQLDRVLATGVDIPEIHRWNYELAQTIKKINNSKNVNVIVLFYNHEYGPFFYKKVLSEWMYGFDTDVIVLIGTDGLAIKNVKVINENQAEKNLKSLENSILFVQTLDSKRVLKEIEHVVVNYFTVHNEPSGIASSIFVGKYDVRPFNILVAILFLMLYPLVLFKIFMRRKEKQLATLINKLKEINEN